MAYAALSDVQGLLAKWEITASSKPNATQAGAIITQVSAEIDSVISSAGYAVPVTTPAWFLDALKLLNCYGAAAAIIRSMFPDATGPDETPAYAYYAAQYKAGLARLAADGIPPDVPRGTGTVNPSTY